jgi:hypothetical protein
MNNKYLIISKLLSDSHFVDDWDFARVPEKQDEEKESDGEIEEINADGTFHMDDSEKTTNVYGDNPGV